MTMKRRFEFCIDANDVDKLADFWCQALDYEPYDRFEQYLNLIPKKGQIGPVLVLQKVPDKKATKDRIHLDIYSSEPDELIRQLVSAGASKLGDKLGNAKFWWQVMQDPEGNEFCIMPETADSKPDKPNVI